MLRPGGGETEREESKKLEVGGWGGVNVLGYHYDCFVERKMRQRERWTDLST